MSIQDYMSNLIAGKFVINGLYNAVYNARRICGQGGQFSYTFTLQGIGSKRYKGCELVRLDDETLCQSVGQIIGSSFSNGLTLDQMVKILLKGKNEICGLYGSFIRAENAVSQAKILCYTFNNPYGMFANVNKNRIRLSAQQVLDLFKKSKNVRFNPLIIII